MSPTKLTPLKTPYSSVMSLRTKWDHPKMISLSRAEESTLPVISSTDNTNSSANYLQLFFPWAWIKPPELSNLLYSSPCFFQFCIFWCTQNLCPKTHYHLRAEKVIEIIHIRRNGFIKSAKKLQRKSHRFLYQEKRNPFYD